MSELAVDTSSSLQCREVVQRVSLLMNVVSVYQFTDGIQVCCVQDKLEAAGLMWYINSLRKTGRKICFIPVLASSIPKALALSVSAGVPVRC